MGYLMPKFGGGELDGWPAMCTAGRLGFGELPPHINGGAHSLHL
jgi:hypothetical protein